PFAIIHEAVNIAKKKGHKGIASFVNGVLRNIDRNGLKDIANIKDPIERISIEMSHPLWLVQRWSDYYGIETNDAICKENLERKLLSVRVNQLNINREILLKQDNELGIIAYSSPKLEEALVIDEENILKTDLL